MQLALVEARKALAWDEVPIGAVVAVGNEIVAAGFNQPISLSIRRLTPRSARYVRRRRRSATIA